MNVKKKCLLIESNYLENINYRFSFFICSFLFFFCDEKEKKRTKEKKKDASTKNTVNF